MAKSPSLKSPNTSNNKPLKLLNILILNYEFPPLGGGASPVSYEIAKAYASLGHKVDVITMHFKGLPFQEKKDNINIYRVKCLRSKKEICHPWEQLSYLIAAKKFLKHHIKINKTNNPNKTLINDNKPFNKNNNVNINKNAINYNIDESALDVNDNNSSRSAIKDKNASSLNNTQYDICHCHFIIPTGLLALWLKRNYNLPYIITSHGSDVLGYNKRFKYLYPLIQSKWKTVIRESSAIVTPSKFLQDKIRAVMNDNKDLKNDVISHNIANDDLAVHSNISARSNNQAFHNHINYHVIPNGVDPSKFKPLKKEKSILVVSRLFINKGVHDILKAIVPIKDELKDKGWKVDIVGDGPERLSLIKFAIDNHLESIVKFHGWIDNSSPQMKSLYGKASIFVSASYFENMSMVILEALASGCKVLASNVGGNPEVVNKSDLFGAKDINGLKNNLLKTINNKISKSKLNNRFNITSVVKEYENLAYN